MYAKCKESVKGKIQWGIGEQGKGRRGDAEIGGRGDVSGNNECGMMNAESAGRRK